ncbi:GLPGLI family protein [Bergeyella sp. RCAD1439]|uniref:GLPGLI family protein n=1 Tax=Bergeyella anatis TaxID=3113737 RepID=UPI002E16E434|nr:GLPGLI family protein [Bergeyella sp. RCAD1439]
MRTKKMILSVLFLNLGMMVWAQTNRFIYQLTRQVGNGPQKDLMVLDVNPKEVKFYDLKFLESDSLSKKTPGHVFRTVSSTKQVLKRDKNQHTHLNFFTNNDSDYFVIPSSDAMDWEVTSVTKKSPENLILQKARTHFGGRDWEAWFAKEIPVMEGPYKFNGLPGLIYEIYDTEQKFHYVLVKNKVLGETYATENFLETYYDKTPLKINHEQWVKLMLNDYQDPVAYLTRILKNGGSININGEDIHSISQLDQKRKMMQESIIKHYLPIELDKAIPYPDKPSK